MSKLNNEKKPDRVLSPEHLDGYLKVTSVKLWVILVAVIVVLLGIIVFGFTAKIEITVPSTVQYEGGSSLFFVKAEDYMNIREGNKIRLENGDEGVITQISDKAIIVSKDTFSEYFMTKGGYTEGEILFAGFADFPEGHGVYSGNIVIGEANPFTVL